MTSLPSSREAARLRMRSDTLAASNSNYMRGMAKVCADVCEDCAAECRKHAEEHHECRDCMEACERVIPQLKQLAA